MIHTSTASKPSLWRQPGSVWAIAFACMVSFMGIGLVDPILPAISRELEASASQTMLLFTSYLFITGIAMFFTSWVSARIGVKRTLLTGLVLIVAFAALAGASGSVNQILGYRAGWGLGNALFISTALAAIVGAASGGSRQAIVLYEAALGVGMATGPLLGGMLGDISWRGPFFGTAVLMAIGLVAILAFLRAPTQAPVQVSLLAGFRALRNKALLALAVTAVFYNFGFFVLLAYSPFPLEAAAHAQGMEFGAHELGLVFFGWGLALAVTSVLVAPPLTRNFGLRPTLFTMLGALAVILGAMAVFHEDLVVLIVLIVVAGLALGVMNTALTEAVMEATDLPRNVASSTYSGVRFLGGAIAPAVAGPLATALGAGAPYWFGAGSIVVAILVLAFAGHTLSHIGVSHESEQEVAEDLTAADA
ncbi:MFS transporter [Glutamicibacter creatinolyticus]|uniref:Multidrug efflux protein YfmO n=2 Tax=Glutamicibacter creatinolyticus TaxID=162496 RepID=A0A5B7WU39_9MICC|nr:MULTISPECIES: MFS transporter [Glutamicibacter]QCY47422.1 Multidrug efflux protein YfmO [Glutamicibacter creatinolyticus]